jgi:hypothetical protein
MASSRRLIDNFAGRCTLAERESFVRAAELAGVSLSEYARQALRERVQRDERRRLKTAPSNNIAPAAA